LLFLSARQNSVHWLIFLAALFHEQLDSNSRGRFLPLLSGTEVA